MLSQKKAHPAFAHNSEGSDTPSSRTPPLKNSRSQGCEPRLYPGLPPIQPAATTPQSVTKTKAQVRRLTEASPATGAPLACASAKQRPNSIPGPGLQNDRGSKACSGHPQILSRVLATSKEEFRQAMIRYQLRCFLNVLGTEEEEEGHRK